jgi:septal ring factor EnvC (AmiA/AmiB activator)
LRAKFASEKGELGPALSREKEELGKLQKALIQARKIQREATAQLDAQDQKITELNEQLASLGDFLASLDENYATGFENRSRRLNQRLKRTALRMLGPVFS